MITVKVIGLNKFKRTINSWRQGLRKLERYLHGPSPYDNVAPVIEKHIEDQFKSTYKLKGWPTARVRAAVESFSKRNCIIIDFTSQKSKKVSQIKGVAKGMLSVVENNSQKYIKMIEKNVGQKVKKVLKTNVKYSKGI